MNEEREVLKLSKCMENLNRSIEVPDSVSPKEVKKMLGKKDNKIYKYITAAACVLLTVSIVGISVFVSSGLLGISKPISESDVKSYGNQKTAKSYDEVYDAIEKYERVKAVNNFSEVMSFDWLTKNGLSRKDDVLIEESIPKEGTSMAADIKSETNIQVEGVDEADVIKNDSRYIYYIKDNRIIILDANNPQTLVKIADFNFTEREVTSCEMFLQSGARLTVLWNENKIIESGSSDIYNYSFEASTCAAVYDIENPVEPKFIRKFSQDGQQRDFRMVENNLYIISECSYLNAEKDDIDTYIPHTNDSVSKGEKAIACENIILPEKLNDVSYAIVSLIDTASAEKKAETKAVLGSASTIYATAENLYLLGNICNDKSNSTIIQRFSIKDGLEATGSVTVPGITINQFAVDEYNGYLRIGTTTTFYDNSASSTTNSLFVLDENLKLCGSIIDIAPTEKIYSMRYEGEKAYMVTFRQTDPLYAIDLADPQNPKITGKLKIPGFSNYMHPVGEGLMLGIGQDANESTGATMPGIKLSLFDVSDMSSPKEICVTMLLQAYDWSSTPTEYNHKTFVDLGDNKYGFPYRAEKWNSGSEYGFAVIKIENGEIKVEELLSDKDSDYNDYMRGVRIKDCLILVDDNSARSYLIENYEKKSEIEI